MEPNKKSNTPGENGFFKSHPIVANLLAIIIVAVVGILIVYYSLALFTKHGRHTTVPSVENMSYTEAVSILHDRGLRVDIRDSIYNEEVRPGFVIEQFPKSGSVVKPGRKIFLYINAVHPREVVLDDDNHPETDALKNYPFREVMARLEELGFKDVKVVKVLGPDDRVVKILANGRLVKKTQKVPVNARIVVEVSDGRLEGLAESLSILEQMQYSSDYGSGYDYPQPEENPDYGNPEEENPYYQSSPSSEPSRQEEPDEEPEYGLSE